LIPLNIGEKISLYKERSGVNSYREFGDKIGVSERWIRELTKIKTIKEIKLIDINNLMIFCDYLGITIKQLFKNDEDTENTLDNKQIINIDNIDDKCYDVGIVIDEMKILLDKDEIKMNGIKLNSKAKQICKDSLDVVKTLVRQYL
jgi:transcriptional regulator with XRE-family HTH domain